MKRCAWAVALVLLAASVCFAGPARFKAGSYTGSSKGMGGLVTVEVVFSADTIKSVKIVSQSETPSIAGPALERIPAAIVARQSLAVDTVSGATVSSKAIIEAVADAAAKAGADVAALRLLPALAAKSARPPKPIKLSADVVVIGAGGAGLSAALEASDRGAKKVILLEKMASIGGTTFISQGLIGGFDTKLAKKQGIKISYEAMYDNLMSNAMYRLDPVLAGITVQRSGETIDWLAERVKVPFLDAILVGYGPLQMMHQVEGGGAGMLKPFSQAISDAKIDLMLETRALSLVMNERGAVKAVKAERAGGDVTIECKAVVVATGGYANNPTLTALLDPEKAGTYGIGFSGATGDGIIMGNNVGAALSHMNHLMAVLKDFDIMAKHAGTSATANVSRFIAAPNCVLVGADGKRFVDEKSGGYMTQELNAPIFNQMHKDGLGYVWAISDVATLKTMGVKRGLGMEFIVADTVEELAGKMGLNPAALIKTVESYNGYAKDGFDPEFKRVKPVALNAPYCAVSVVPCEIITYGGLARNEKAEVLRADGSVIGGLYVAGEAGGNSAYMGFTLSNAFTWGRIAGSGAAAFVTKK